MRILALAMLVLAGPVLIQEPALAQEATGTTTDTILERQSWRAQQTILTPAERREGERRLDAIDLRAKSDPRAARDMQRIWEADRALGTQNRPGPGGPSLVGPGDRN